MRAGILSLLLLSALLVACTVTHPALTPRPNVLVAGRKSTTFRLEIAPSVPDLVELRGTIEKFAEGRRTLHTGYTDAFTVTHEAGAALTLTLERTDIECV